MRVYNIITLLLLSLTAVAQNNFEVAKNFMTKKGVIIVEDSLNKTRSSSEQYNIYRGINNKGFVIVVNGSVIGYSTDSQVDYENLPDGLTDLIKCYTRAINRNGEGSYPEDFKRKGWKPIEPLVSALWNQHAPYNNDCPFLKDYKCSSGCVPTAIAMVMYYYQYPTKFEPFEGHDTLIDDDEEYKTVLEPLPEYEIQWDKMLDSYRAPHEEENEKAVSGLLMNLGYRLCVTYSKKCGTIGDTGGLCGLYQCYCSYSTYVARDAKPYTDVERDSLFYISLLDSRPIIVSGGNSSGSRHAYLIDGCDSDGLYHINWGWGGSSNGYYLISQELFNKYATKERDYWSLYNGEPISFVIPLFPKDNIRKPTSFTINDIRFHISSTKAVEVIGNGDKTYKGDITIPQSVDYNGVTYSVASIASQAFSNCCDLTSVVVPNSITVIDIGAFSSCSSLTSFTLGDKVTSVGYDAFKGCSSLKTIYSYNTAPPEISDISFDEGTYENALLYVPKGCKTVYSQHLYWEKFKNIVELDATNVNDITVDNSTSNEGVYTLEGIKVSSNADNIDNLPKGIYLVNGKKVIIK